MRHPRQGGLIQNGVQTGLTSPCPSKQIEMNCLNIKGTIRLSHISKEMWCQAGWKGSAALPQIFSLLCLCFPSSLLSSFTTSFNQFNYHSFISSHNFFPCPPSSSPIGALLSLDACFHLWEKCDWEPLSPPPSLFLCVLVLHNTYTPITWNLSHAEIYRLSRFFNQGVVMHLCACSRTFSVTIR